MGFSHLRTNFCILNTNSRWAETKERHKSKEEKTTRGGIKKFLLSPQTCCKNELKSLVYVGVVRQEFYF